MDGSKFAKLTKDLDLLDKQLTSTEVDLIFTKVKPKAERKITLQQFEEALVMMALKKYPGDEGGVEKLRGVVMQGKGPSVHGATKAAKSAAVERLTDCSKFTGTHKERFDEEGKGKGIAGRRDVPTGDGYVTGYKEKGSYSKKVTHDK